MMAKDPAQRLQSAARVVERLAPWAGQPAQPRATTPLESLSLSSSGGFPPPIIIPPPVIIPPLPQETADPTGAGGKLRDTVTDLPGARMWAGNEEDMAINGEGIGDRNGDRNVRSDADEEESLSVVVETPPPIPLVRPILLCVVVPVVLVTVMTLLACLVKILFS